MICSRCKTNLQQGVAICPICGLSIYDKYEPDEKKEKKNNMPQIDWYDIQVGQRNKGKKKVKEKNTTILKYIFLILLLIIVFIIITIFLA